MSNKALILVDLENEWQDENSEYYAGDLSGLIKKTNQLLDYAREEGYKIIFIRHVEKESDSAFAEDSANTKIISDVEKADSDLLITKYKISPFYNTSLSTVLDGIEEIIVGGILTNLCVRSLIHDAYDREFKITVISDCCKAFDDETHNFTLKDLKATRPEITITSLEEFIK